MVQLYSLHKNSEEAWVELFRRAGLDDGELIRECASMFIGHKIRLCDVPSLTDAHFEALGVQTIGDKFAIKRVTKEIIKEVEDAKPNSHVEPAKPTPKSAITVRPPIERPGRSLPIEPQPRLADKIESKVRVEEPPARSVPKAMNVRKRSLDEDAGHKTLAERIGKVSKTSEPARTARALPDVSTNKPKLVANAAAQSTLFKQRVSRTSRSSDGYSSEDSSYSPENTPSRSAASSRIPAFDEPKRVSTGLKRVTVMSSGDANNPSTKRIVTGLPAKVVFRGKDSIRARLGQKIDRDYD